MIKKACLYIALTDKSAAWSLPIYVASLIPDGLCSDILLQSSLSEFDLHKA